MTDKEKTDRVIEWLAWRYVCDAGGYPCDWVTHGGLLFVAGLDHDGATAISTYDLDELPKWYDRATSWHRKSIPDWPSGLEPHDYGEWNDALEDTTPSPSVQFNRRQPRRKPVG